MTNKISLIGIILILSNSCCLEQSHNLNWTITNNSSDTLFIKFTENMYPDSVVVLPKNTSDLGDGGFGKYETFYCSKVFEDELIEVKISGNKNLIKDLKDNENWIQNSDNGRCSTNFSCYFEINQTDVE